MFIKTESGFIFGSRDPNRTLRVICKEYLGVRPTKRAMRNAHLALKHFNAISTGMTTLTLVR